MENDNKSKEQVNVNEEVQKDIQPQDQSSDNAEKATKAVEAPTGEVVQKADQKTSEGKDAGPQNKKPAKEFSRHRPRRGDDGEAPEFLEKVISINRITKVTKGGKKLSFSALVVVGDMKGRVGYGHDKAGEVATAIKKSLAVAKKSMIRVPLKGTTIPHQINGECGSALVMLKPASEGTGVIAAGPVRAVCDAVGIHNILTKCHTSNNPINVIKATVNGLSRLKTKEDNE